MLLAAVCLLGSAVAGSAGNSYRYVEYAGGKIHLFDTPGCRGAQELMIAIFDIRAEKKLERALACWRYQDDRILIFRSDDELPIIIDRDLELHETFSDDPPVPA